MTGHETSASPHRDGSAPKVPVAPASPLGVGDGEQDRQLLEITYEGAASSLERIISPSLADFLD